MARETSDVLVDGLDRTHASLMGIDERTREWAGKLHRKACTLGRLRGIWSSFVGVDRRLLDLNNLRRSSALLDWGYAGMREIAIDHIIGSEGHCGEFDRSFYPLPGHDELRWLMVAAGILSEVNSAPIEIVQVGSSYYAQTGQYQISVARALGRKQIAAYVTGWELQGRERANVRVRDAL